MAAKNHLPLYFLFFIVIFLAFATVNLLVAVSHKKTSPAPIVGCHYESVQCIKAPCDPVLICDPTPTPQRADADTFGCRVGGCGGQLCIDEKFVDEGSTCEYRAQYACYESAKCERQTDGKCGWTKTPQLVRCLQSPPPLQ